MGTESTFVATRKMVLAIVAAIALALVVSFSALGLELASNAENHSPAIQPHHVSHIYSGPIGGGHPINPGNPSASSAG